MLLSQTGRPAEAEAEFRAALAIHEKLAAENPAVTDFRSRLANHHNNLGHLLSERAGRRRRRSSTARHWRSTRSWPTRTPPSPSSAADLADSHELPRQPAVAGGQAAEAEAEYRQALAIHQKLADDNPKVPELPQRRGLLPHQPRRRCSAGCGRPAEARDGCDRAIAIREALVKEDPKVPMYRSDLA